MYGNLELFIDGKWHGADRPQDRGRNQSGDGEAARQLAFCMQARPISNTRWMPLKRLLRCGAPPRPMDRCRIMRKAAGPDAQKRYDTIAKIMVLEQGKTYPGSPRRGDHVGRYHRMVRRRRPPFLWPHRAGPFQGHPAARDAGADRRGRGIHAVEFPGADAGAQSRRCARGRLLFAHPQGVGRNASAPVSKRWCAASPMPDCRRAWCSTWCSACRRKSPNICSPRMRCARFRSPARSRSASISPCSPPKAPSRTTMELGGHSPVVVFADADPEEGGERRRRVQVSQCRPGLYFADPLLCSGRRLFALSQAILPAYANGIKIGDGLEKGITMGPMANARRINEPWRASSTTPRATAAKIQTGGKRHGNQGFFYEPTVITDVPDDAKIMKNRPFKVHWPRSSPFKTFDEVVERPSSLGAGSRLMPSRHPERDSAARIPGALDSGMVGVNSVMISTPETPFR